MPDTTDPTTTAAPTPDEDDEAMRAYVSRLWADDWDSEDDAVYDNAE